MKLFSRKIIPIYIISGIILIFFVLKWGDHTVKIDTEEKQYTSVFGNRESCFACHDQQSGYSPYHDPKNIGCTACHLGNPGSNDKEKAHENMVLIPGNLADAEKTCGKCHVEELKKINNSLMTTNSGLIAVDKFIFGEADSPDHHYHVKDLKFSKTDQHLRSLCMNCHLGAEKKEYGEIGEMSRGGGCNACHLNYSPEALSDLHQYFNSGKEILPKFHPSTDIKVSDEHCYGCHSRSSRISTNYQGWQETLLDSIDVIGNKQFKQVADGRIYRFLGEDVHHSKGLLCVDCHSSHEVMGTGKAYLHEEQAVSLQCSDCHYKDRPNTIKYDQLDAESSLVFLHRKYSHQDQKMLAVKKDGHPLVNTFLDDEGDVFLIGKGDGKIHPVKKQSELCARDKAHAGLACSTCHSQWAPRCIGCHNAFEKNVENAYDLLDKKMVDDHWVEYVSEFDAALPTLGVRENSVERKIEPALPGMIMTIDHSSFEGGKDQNTSFHRLYAPNSPHTTSKHVRSCASCHTSPDALGYGMGELTYSTASGKGIWSYKPAYQNNPNDNLPEDAWIPFLGSQKAKIVSTRSDFRPFTVKEQKRILLVGACLQCHEEKSEIMKETLIKGLDPVLKKISKQCILPEK